MYCSFLSSSLPLYQASKRHAETEHPLHTFWVHSGPPRSFSLTLLYCDLAPLQYSCGHNTAHKHSTALCPSLIRPRLFIIVQSASQMVPQSHFLASFSDSVQAPKWTQLSRAHCRQTPCFSILHRRASTLPLLDTQLSPTPPRDSTPL